MFRSLKDSFLGIKSGLNLPQNRGRLLKPYIRKLVFMQVYTPLDLGFPTNGCSWVFIKASSILNSFHNELSTIH